MVETNLNLLGEEYGVLEEHQHAIEGPVDWVISKVSQELVAEFVVIGHGPAGEPRGFKYWQHG